MAKRKPGRVLLREVLAEMRAGATIRLGCSRSHATYSFHDGGWWYEDFDEGHVEEHPIEEAYIRELIRREKDQAREIIRRARWRPFSAAFLRGGDPRRALELLEASRRFGERLRQSDILEAFLRFPDTLDPEVEALIKSELEGFTAFHVFMDAAGWDRSPETSRKGVLYVDRLIAMVGPCPGCYRVRAAFHNQAGDFAPAVADTERELARTPAGTWRHEQLSEYLATLRARLARAEADAP